jgi:hypothetical protein
VRFIGNFVYILAVFFQDLGLRIAGVSAFYGHDFGTWARGYIESVYTVQASRGMG